jgi:hypothetical protein
MTTDPGSPPRIVIEGNVVTERDGQIVEGLEVHAHIFVRHADVVIRDNVIVPAA